MNSYSRNYRALSRISSILIGALFTSLLVVIGTPQASAAPVITSLDVTSGSTAGGNVVTITGSGFGTNSTVTVTLGGTAVSTYLTRNSDTSIKFISPAHAAGTVDVVVSYSSVSTTLTNGFNYNTNAIPPPYPTVAAGYSIGQSNNASYGMYLYVSSFTVNSLSKSVRANLYDSDLNLIGTNAAYTSGTNFYGLKPGATYKVTLQSVGDGTAYTTGPESQPVSITINSATKISTPATPTFTAITGTSFTANVVAATGATNYIFKLWNASDSLLKTVTLATTTASFTDLSPGTTYKVSVIALGNGTSYTQSDESTKGSQGTTASTTATNPNTTALTSSSPTTLTFTVAAPSPGITIRSTLYLSDQTTVVSSIPVSSGAVTFSGLTPATNYYLQYLVIGDGINSTTGTPSNFLLGRTANADAVIAAPTITYTSRTANSLTLSTSSITGASSYLVYLSNSSGTLISRYEITASGAFTVTGLNPSTTYQIKLSAQGIGFPESIFSNVITQQTDVISISKLDTPTVGTVTSTINSITIPITSTVGNGIYFVGRLFASDQTTLVAVVTSSSSSISFSNLAPGTNYYYTVYLAGNSQTNSDSSATPLVLKATSSYALTVTTPSVSYSASSPAALYVSFTVSPTNGSLSNTLNIFASDGTTLVGTIPNYVSNAQVPGLLPNTTYYFSVTSIGDGVFYTTTTSTKSTAFTTRAAVALPVVLPQIATLTPQSVVIAFVAPTGYVSMTARLYSSADELLTVFPLIVTGNTLSAILKPETTYKITLQSIGNGASSLTSAESAKVTFTTPAIVTLQTPTLTASAVGLTANSASFAFTAPATGTYSSCRLKIYSSDMTLLFQVPSYVSGAAIPGLLPNTTYKATLKCFGNGSGYLDSPESLAATLVTGAVTQLLPPAIASITPAVTTFTVNYLPEIGTLFVRLKLYDSNDNLLQTIPNALVATPSYVLTGLIAGSQYKVTATALGNGTTLLDSIEGPKFSFTANSSAAMQVPNPSISAVAQNSATITIAEPLLGFSVLKIYNADASVLLTTITTTLGANSLTIPNLNPGTKYQVSVFALGTGAGYTDSAESDKISFTTIASNQLVSPTPVLNSTAQTTITFQFTAVAGSIAYVGKLYSASGTLLGIYPQFFTTATVAGSAYAGAPLTGLLPSTTYKFTITAIGNSTTYRDGLESIPTNATTTAPITLMAVAPTSITVTPATVTLTLPTVTGAVSQTVRIYNSANKLIATIPSYVSGSVITSPFLPGNKYQLTLQAIGNGITTSTSEESAKVGISTPDAITLSAPIPVNTTTTPNQITLNFTSPTGSLSTIAKVYSADGNTLLASIPGVASTGSYGSFQPNTTYQVSLTAIGNGLSYLTSPESGKFIVKTSPPITLSPPTFTSYPLSGTSVGLSITAVTGAVNYTVKAYSADGTTLISTNIANTTVTPISGLMPNTKYQFSVTAIGNGTSYLNSVESSRIISATTALATALPNVPNSSWIKSAGGIFSDVANAVVVDSSNNVYVSGYFTTQATFGSGSDSVQLTAAGSSDIFLAKYSSSGTLLWVRQAGGTGNDIAYALKIDASGNILVGGVFAGVATFGTDSNRQSITSQGGDDGFMAKYGADGTFSWVRQISGTGTDRVSAISADASGNIFVVGFFSSNLVLGAGAAKVTLRTFGNYDAFLAKYASNGSLTWVRQIGGTSIEYGYGVDVDKSGNAIVSGAANAGVVIGSGATAQTLLVQGGYDAFIAKYNPSGELQWLQSGGGASTDFAYQVSVDSNDNIYVAGYFIGGATFGTGADAQVISAALTITGGTSQDGFIAKYSSSGRLQWIKTIGGPSTDSLLSIAVDSVGNVYAGGSFNISSTVTGGGQSQNLSSQGATDAVVTKFSSDGTLLWARTAGGANADVANAVAVNRAGALAIVGSFSYTQPTLGGPSVFSFGSDAKTLDAQSGLDVFVTLLQTLSDQSSSKLASPIPSASEIKSTSAAISFSNQSGAVSYTLKLYDAAGSSLIATYTNYSPGKQITSLGANTTYNVSVTAIGDGASTISSDESIKVSFTTSLASPTPIVFNIGVDQALVSFATVPGATSYTVNVYDSTASSKLFTYNSTSPRNNIISYLVPGVTYKVSIKPVADGYSNLTFSESSFTTFTTSLATTLSAPVATQSASTATSVTMNIPSVLVSPQMVTGTRAWLVRIYQSDGTTLIGAIASTSAPIVIDGLTPASTYKVSVTAIGDGVQYLNSLEGARNLVSTSQSGVSPAPVPLISQITSNTFTVSFAPIPALVATSYVVSINGYTFIGMTSGAVYSTGISPNGAYTVTAQALGDETNLFTSTPSSPITFSTVTSTTTQLSAPKPTISALTATSMTILASPTIGATGYIANFYETTGTTLLFSSPISVSGTTISSLKPNTNYKIELIALGNGVFLTSSAASTKISVSTLAGSTLAVPTNITTTTVTASSFRPLFTGSINAVSHLLKLYKIDGTSLIATIPNVTSASTLIATGLGSGTSFKFSLTAMGNGVQFFDSAESALVTVDLIAVQTLLAPTPNISSILSNSVTIGFIARANSTYTTARLYSSSGVLLSTFVQFASATKISTNLAPSTEYQISLTAIGDGVNYLTSAEGPKVAFKTAAVQQLVAPLAQIATTSPRVAYLVTSITQIGQISAVAKVYASDGSTLLFNLPGITAAANLITGLAPATTYQIKMQALGDGVNFTNSDIGVATTFTTPASQKLIAPTPTVSYNSATSFKINFPNVTGAISYVANIYIETNTVLTRTLPVVSGTAIFGLPASTSYKVSLIANGDGVAFLNSDPGVSTTFTFASVTAGTTLSSPTPNVSSITTNSARIAFATTTGASSYTAKIYAADGTTLLQTVPRFTSSSAISNLAPITTYKVSVTAIGDGTNFLDGPEGTKTAFITTSLPVPDVAPTLNTPAPSATPNSNSVAISFDNVIGASSYTARIYASDGVSTVATTTRFSSGSSISGLTASTNYSVTVTAIGDGVTNLSSSESTKVAFSTSAPSNLVAPSPSQVGQNSSAVRVAFTGITGAVGYTLRLYANDGATLISTYNGFASGDFISDLAENTNYKIAVTALGDGINSSNSAPSSLLTIKSALSPPVGVITSVRPSSFAVAFDSVTNATGYILKIYDSSGSTLISSTDGYTNGTVITGLTPSTTYKVALIAKGNGSTFFDSSQSSLVSAVTPAPITLSAPSAYISGITTTTTTITFADIADSISYTAKLYAADGTTLIRTLTVFTSGSTISSLTPSTTYKVSVTAVGDGTNILTSVEGSKATLLTIDQVSMIAPAPNVSSSNSSSATITFTPAAGSLSTSAKLYAADGTTLLRTINGFTSGSVITGLTQGTSYKLTLKAIGDGVTYLTSTESSALSISTTAVVTLATPSPSISSITTTTFKVGFTSIANASGHALKLYSSDGTTLLRTISPYDSGTAISGLTVATSYVVKMIALGNGTTFQTSSESTGTNATTASLVTLNAPTPAVTVVTPTSITVAFTASPSATSTRARIYTGDGLTLISLIANVSTGMQFSGLTPDTDYQISLQAMGDDVATISSAESTFFATHTAQPISLSAPSPTISNVTSGSFRLTFTAITGSLGYIANIYGSDGVTLIASYTNVVPSGTTISGLSGLTTYKVSLQSIGDEATYLTSRESAFQSLTTLQGVVTLDSPNPSIDSIGSTSVKVTFGSVANAVSYTAKIYVEGNATALTTLTNFTSGGIITGLTQDTSYLISLKTIGDGTYFLTSNEGTKVSFKTAAPIVLSAPVVTFGSATATSASLSVAAVEGAVDYAVKVYAGDGTTLLFTDESYSSGSSIGGLSPSTNYLFKVAALGDGVSVLNSSYSTPITGATTALPQLLAPTPTIFSTAQTSAVFAFTPIAGAASYRIKLYQADGTTLISTTNGFTSGSSISGLTANTTYQVGMISVGDGATNTTSNTGELVSFTTLSVQQLAAPTIFVSTRLPSSLAVSFAAISGAVSYTAKIYSADGNTLLSSVDGFTSGGTFASLNVDTGYQVAVLAHGDGTNYLDSNLSDKLQTSTTPIPTLLTPDAVALATGTTTATASFSSQSNAVKFTLKVYAANGTTLIKTVDNYVSGATITGLTNSTKYQITVVAVGDGVSYLTSEYSSQDEITTASPSILSSPTISVGSATQTTIVVTYTTVSNAISYTLNIYNSGGNVLQTITSFTSGATVSGLSAGNTYSVGITAVGDTNNFLDSSESNRSSITTAALPTLAAPSLTASSRTRSGFNFTVSSVSNAVNYEVKLYAVDGTTVLQSWTALTTSYALTGLSKNTRYFISAKSLAASGYQDSSESAKVAVDTLDLSILAAPSASMTARTQTTLKIEFAPISHASSYTAKIRTGDGATLLRTLENFTSGTVIASLTRETTYLIEVIAIGDGVDYANSTNNYSVSATTEGLPALAAPSLTTKTLTTDSASFTYGLVTDAISYTLKIYSSGNNLIRTVNSYVNEAPIDGLSPNTTYGARILAIADGTTKANSPESTLLSFTTQGNSIPMPDVVEQPTQTIQPENPEKPGIDLAAPKQPEPIIPVTPVTPTPVDPTPIVPITPVTPTPVDPTPIVPVTPVTPTPTFKALSPIKFVLTTSTLSSGEKKSLDALVATIKKSKFTQIAINKSVNTSKTLLKKIKLMQKYLTEALKKKSIKVGVRTIATQKANSVSIAGK